MFRLAVATCVVLGAALAKPSLPAGRDEIPVEPLGVEPAPFQDNPQPLKLYSGAERSTYTLAPGTYFFTSPNYPNNYPNNHDFSVTLRAENHSLVLMCHPFNMETHSRCSYDYLSVNERRYCGTSPPPATQLTEMRIRIKTDSSVTAPGFYCLLTAF